MAQNSPENQDLRVRRTRKFLQEALMELTAQKGFEAVTIKDICERAMVNRATFYRHFVDKYDLVDRYMDDLYNLLDPSQAEAANENPNEPPAGLIEMLEHVRGQADFYRAMLGPKGYPPFAERIRFYIEKRLRRNLPGSLKPSGADDPPPDMLLRSLSSASLGAIQWWLEKGDRVSPEQMAAWLVQLSRAMFDR